MAAVEVLALPELAHLNQKALECEAAAEHFLQWICVLLADG